MRPFTRADLFTAAIGALAFLAGLVLVLAAGDTIASIIGAGLLGLGGIAFVALAFLLVGESEDRDRRNGAL